jgi:hypothetical protein
VTNEDELRWAEHSQKHKFGYRRKFLRTGS